MERATSRSIHEVLAEDGEQLREIVRNEPRAHLAQAAAWAMANRMEVGPLETEALLARLGAATAEEVDLISTILWALALDREGYPVSRVLPFLRHPSTAIRAAAVRSIGTFDLSEATLALVEVAEGDPSPENRAEAIAFLSLRLDPSDAVDRVGRALAREREPAVLGGWVTLLGRHARSTSAAAELLWTTVLDDRTTLSVRCAAAESLAARDPRDARRIDQEIGLPQAVRTSARPFVQQ